MIACGWLLCRQPRACIPQRHRPAPAACRSFRQPAHRGRRLVLFHGRGRGHGHAWPRSAAAGGALEDAGRPPRIALPRVFCRAVLRLMVGHAKAARESAAWRHRGRLWNVPAGVRGRGDRSCGALLRRAWTRRRAHRRQCRGGHARRRLVRRPLKRGIRPPRFVALAQSRPAECGMGVGSDRLPTAAQRQPARSLSSAPSRRSFSSSPWPPRWPSARCCSRSSCRGNRPGRRPPHRPRNSLRFPGGSSPFLARLSCSMSGSKTHSEAGCQPTLSALSPGGSMAERASAIALCFWVCEMASRGLTAALIRFVREQLFYRVCLLVLIATAATVVFIPHLSATAVFAITAIAAFSLAPLYPLAVSFLLARTGNHPRLGQSLCLRLARRHGPALADRHALDPLPESADWFRGARGGCSAHAVALALHTPT